MSMTLNDIRADVGVQKKRKRFASVGLGLSAPGLLNGPMCYPSSFKIP